VKSFIQTSIAHLVALTLLFAVVGCTTSPTAPTHTVAVTMKFVTPPAKEISGSNKVEVSVTNIKTGKIFSTTISSPKAIVYPDRTFYSLEGGIELPNGPIGEKTEYRLSATYLGIADSPTQPSRDMSHMITVNGMALSYGSGDGMYFALTCDGNIELTPTTTSSSPATVSSRPYFGASQSWFGQFTGGTINVSVEELTVDESGSPMWRPVFTSYDWSSYGLLPTSHFSKMVTAGISWNTSAQLRPIIGEKFVRVKAVVDYPGGASQVVTDQVSLTGSGNEWFGPNSVLGYRIFRLSGGYGGKG